LIFVTAAVNVGAYQLFTNFIGPLLGLDPGKLTVAHQVAGVLLITVSQALLNHFGIRVTMLLTDFSGYLIFAVAVVLTLAMFFGPESGKDAFHRVPHHDWARLFTFTNYSGPPG